MRGYLLGLVAAMGLSIHASEAEAAKLVYDVVFQHFDSSLKIDSPAIIPVDSAGSWDINQAFQVTLYADLTGDLTSYGAFEFRDENAMFGPSVVDDLVAQTLAFNPNPSTPVGSETRLVASSLGGIANFTAGTYFSQADSDLLAGTYNLHTGGFALFADYPGSGFSSAEELAALQSGSPLTAVFTGDVGINALDVYGGRYILSSRQRYTGLAYLNAEKSDLSYSVVPEPATWAMMVGGFGVAGAVLRRRRATFVAA